MSACPYRIAFARCRRLLGRELTKLEFTAVYAALDLHQTVIVHDGKLKVLEKAKNPPISPL